MRILFLFFIFYGFSQEIKTIQYDTENGLPSSEVYDIIQDDYGYLWFATDKGLSRYNGYEFETFDQSNGLINNVVFRFFKQSNGEIWGSTYSMELFKFEGKEPIFSPYEFNKSIKTEKGHLVIKSIYISDNRDVYITFNQSKGFLHISSTGEVKKNSKNIDESLVPVYPYVLKNKSLSSFFFNDNGDEYAKRIPNVEFDKFKERLKTQKNEALYIDEHDVGVYSNGSEIKLKYGNEGIISIDTTNTNKVIGLGKLDKDKFWVGYHYGGAKIFDTLGNEVLALLPNQSVTKLYKDEGSNIWVSTLHGGVFQIRNQEIKLIPESNGRRVNSLCNIDTGIYIGYKSGDIDYFKSNYSVENFFKSNSNKRASIVRDSTNDVTYFCSDYLFSSKSSFLVNLASKYISFNKENIFIGYRTTVILNESDKTIRNQVFKGRNVNDVVFYNKKLYGGGIAGLHVIDLQKDDKESLLIKGTRIDDLNVFNDQLVLGTNSDGVIILNKKNKNVYQFRIEDGLRSNSISRTFTQNDSILWIGTNKGLNRIKVAINSEVDISYIDVDDGLLSNEIEDVTVHNDTLFIGTQKGVNYLSIKAFDKLQNQNQPYFLQWKKILVNNEPISISKDKGNNFIYSENKFEFNYQAISFSNNENLDYRYRLLGQDKEWSLTKNRSIIFSSLAPGKYELQLQVKGRNSNWELNEIKYFFTVHPPFWITWWFISLIILAIIGIIYLIFKVRILTYNKDILREILRLIMQRLRNDKPFVFIKDKGKEIKIYSADIHYIKTNSNYLEIYTSEKKYFIRSSIKQFLNELPDAIEYLQIHRSYVVRLDKIQEVGKKFLVVLNEEIPVGRKYTQALKLIQL